MIRSWLRGAILLAAISRWAGAAENDLARYEKLAAQGDARAMVELGPRHHRGDGVKQDYAAAYDWYLKAGEKSNGDALNNIGVLHRDGLGVPKNQKVAYLLFLYVHMEGLGTDETQTRAGRNLDRLQAELPERDLHEALSYTIPYLLQIVRSRGKDLAIRSEVLPTKERPRIRDNGWWLESERKKMTFESPAPWNDPK